MPTANAPLEWRASLSTSDGEALYRIYDPAKKTGTWVKLNQRSSDFNVLAKQYDPAQETLTVEQDGKTMVLPERKSKVVSSGAAPQMMAPLPTVNNPVSAAVTQSVVLNPTPAQEQQRLEAVAAEVARRRALREQATNQNNQGAVQPLPQPPPAAPVQPQGQMTTPKGARGGPVTAPNRQQR